MIPKIKKRKINETKSWLFEKSNKINKPLARLTTQRNKNNPRRHKLSISGMKQGCHCIITDPTDI